MFFANMMMCFIVSSQSIRRETNALSELFLFARIQYIFFSLTIIRHAIFNKNNSNNKKKTRETISNDVPFVDLEIKKNSSMSIATLLPCTKNSSICFYLFRLTLSWNNQSMSNCFKSFLFFKWFIIRLNLTWVEIIQISYANGLAKLSLVYSNEEIIECVCVHSLQFFTINILNKNKQQR